MLLLPSSMGKLFWIYFCFIIGYQTAAVPAEYDMEMDHESIYDFDTEQSQARYDSRLLSEALQDHHSASQKRSAPCYTSHTKYEHGQRVMRVDPCEMCLCVDGEIFCWWKKCGKIQKEHKKWRKEIQKGKRQKMSHNHKANGASGGGGAGGGGSSNSQRSQKQMMKKNSEKFKMIKFIPKRVLSFPQHLPSMLHFDYSSSSSSNSNSNETEQPSSEQIPLSSSSSSTSSSSLSSSSSSSSSGSVGTTIVGGGVGTHRKNLIKTDGRHHQHPENERSSVLGMAGDNAFFYETRDVDSDQTRRDQENNKNKIKYPAVLATASVSVAAAVSAISVATPASAVDDGNLEFNSYRQQEDLINNGNGSIVEAEHQMNYEDDNELQKSREHHQPNNNNNVVVAAGSNHNIISSGTNALSSIDKGNGNSDSSSSSSSSSSSTNNRHRSTTSTAADTQQKDETEKIQFVDVPLSKHYIITSSGSIENTDILASENVLSQFRNEFKVTAAGSSGVSSTATIEKIGAEGDGVMGIDRNNINKDDDSKNKGNLRSGAVSNMEINEMNPGSKPLSSEFLKDQLSSPYEHNAHPLQSESTSFQEQQQQDSQQISTSTILTTDMNMNNSPPAEPVQRVQQECVVMGISYKIGTILPQETGNCLQCICIEGSNENDAPRVTCSPHNCPPLVLPDLFDTTGY